MKEGEAANKDARPAGATKGRVVGSAVGGLLAAAVGKNTS